LKKHLSTLSGTLSGSEISTLPIYHHLLLVALLQAHRHLSTVELAVLEVTTGLPELQEE